jgi:hypothetical protein
MTSYSGFDPAARLYAENWAIVEAMKTAFEKDIDRFLNAIETEVRSLVDRKFQTKVTTGYRYWWLGADGVDRDSHPQLWLEMRRVEIVVPGQLLMFAAWPKANDEQRSRVSAVVNDPAISSFCTPGNGGPWSLLEAAIDYGPNAMVEPVANSVSRLLKLMSDASLLET